MELVSVVLARVVTFLELLASDPKGQSSALEGVKKLSERYSFIKSPDSLADLDLQKGIDFLAGKLGDINIDKLTLFANGVSVDTRSSTDDCEAVAKDFLAAVRQWYGATVEPTRQMVVSSVIFRSRMRLENLNPVLSRVAAEVASSVSIDYGQPIGIEPVSLGIGADFSQIRLHPASFSIERRSDTPFVANLYFATAPIRTGLHLRLIEEFESALLSTT